VLILLMITVKDLGKTCAVVSPASDIVPNVVSSVLFRMRLFPKNREAVHHSHHTLKDPPCPVSLVSALTMTLDSEKQK
jgi:hypothetical protein